MEKSEKFTENLEKYGKLAEKFRKENDKQKCLFGQKQLIKHLPQNLIKLSTQMSYAILSSVMHINEQW